MKNVVIARLRSNVKYNGPLDTVLDSFFENYLKWMETHPDYNFGVYNVSFNYEKPKRNPEAIKNADVIVIPSDSEFRYHGDVPQLNPKDIATSNELLDEIKPYFEGKQVIMWRSDRGDTKELYLEKTLAGVNLKSFDVIDEIDFPGNIHGMKYHFINNRFKTPMAALFPNKRPIDFAYWGRMKDGDDRGKTIKRIYRDPKISTVLVGGFPGGVERDASWIKDWNILYPMLEKARHTICFNWKDENATTSRYPEALAIGLVPFVWRKYDNNNTYNISDWQRVWSFADYREKALLLKNDAIFDNCIGLYKQNYEKVLLSEEEYSIMFNKMMDKAIND